MKNTFINKIYQGTLIMYLAFTGVTTDADAAGLLTPKDGGLSALEIKDHNVKVVVEDGYAITSVTQVFHNPNNRDLEATYSFPVPDKAAVSEFTMWIDGKPIYGEVLEKKKARQIYEDQKAQGNDTGITEKDSYKTFDISVSPVRAGQDTKIRLSYIQPAHIDTAIGHYVYPLEEGGVDEQKLSFWTANEEVTDNFSFDLYLRTAYPIDSVRLPNHPQAVVTEKNGEYHVHIGNKGSNQIVANDNEQALTINKGNLEVAERIVQQGGGVFNLNKDIVVYYRHVENLPGSVDLVAYKPEAGKRGTFMLTVTPGMDLQPITEGRDWIFVLDISGSMQTKYSTLAEGVSRALKNMSQNDRFRVVLFNSRPSELTNGFTVATKENINRYIDKVRKVNPNDGTNVFAGLKMAMHGMDSDRTTSILLVTDGVANVGITEQKKFIKLVKSKDVRLFTFIMGNSANRPLLEAMTGASGGFAMSVSNSDDIVGSIILAKSKVTHQALHGTELRIKGIRTVDMTPQKAGSLYRGQQLIMFGHYFDDGEATVTLSGKISGDKKQYTTSFKFPEVATDNPEIERLWAFSRIEELSHEMHNFGENADTKQAITDIATEYGLVTDYTSMVVVKDEVFQQLGIDRSNKRRLEREFTAQQTRAAKPVQTRKVDRSNPMFKKNNRPTTRGLNLGGGGSMDVFYILMLLPLMMVALGRRRKVAEIGGEK